MKELLPGLEKTVKRKYRPEPAHKCPYCQTRFTRQRMLLAWRQIQKFFLRNKDAVSREVLARELTNPPQVRLTPDLTFALRAEAGGEGLEVSDLVNEIIDGYFTGEYNRIKRRRRERRQKNKNTNTRTD